jgi:hypothetical protein
MSLHRTALFVLAALFAAGISSAASACCGWGVQAPAPVTYAPAGCGGCGTPIATIVYAQPVAPPPVAVSTWTGGCGCACGCRGFFSYLAPAAEPMPIAPAPIYVTNQGPDYSGPGIMVPYHTWTPASSYVVPGSYPYLPGYGYGYRHRYGYAHGYGYRYGVHRPHIGARVAYHARFYGHPLYHGAAPGWRHRYYR